MPPKSIAKIYYYATVIIILIGDWCFDKKALVHSEAENVFSLNYNDANVFNIQKVGQ
jgi:hypothetical protein